MSDNVVDMNERLNLLKMKKMGGTFTSKIVENIEFLNSQGWNIKTSERHLEEFSAIVDFENKEVSMNIPKAQHAYLVLERVIQVVPENHALNSYVYKFVGGEEIIRDDGSIFNHDYLQVTKIEG